MMQPAELADTAAGLMPWLELLLRFLLNLATIFVLVRMIYYPQHKQKDYLFTFFLFNLVIFLICILLSASMMKMGFAFGLFAIFSMIRYRTVSIPVKEMGYFFVCVALGMINALAANAYGYSILIAADLLILLVVLILDRYVHLRHEEHKEVIYERIELIVPERRAELLADLRQRTGIPVHRVAVVSVDLLRDTALLHVYYFEQDTTAVS